MKGSVRKHGNSWQYRINLGTVNGQRKQLERSGFPTKKEATIAMTAQINEYNMRGTVFIDKKLRFDEVYTQFIEIEAPSTRKISTIKRYSSLYNNHLEPEFSNRYIISITSLDIQKFLSSKTDTHSVEYIRSIHNFLHVLFSYAIRMDYITVNPMDNVNPPKQLNANKITVYTLDELQLLNNRLKTTSLQPAFQIGINLGLRAGECFALCWSDFDFEKNTVTIDKQLQYYNKAWCFTTLKTQNSYRTITFSDTFKTYLLEQKSIQEALKEGYGLGYKNTNTILDSRYNKDTIVHINDFVNIKSNGEMLNTNSTKVASRIFKSEFNMAFKYHNLRHTHATMLIENGVNPKFVQERLGHSKLDFTLKVYTQVTSSMDSQACSILDSKLKFD